MNTFDLVLLVMLSVLVLLGIFKGMTRILIGIAALIAAFLLAAQFHNPLATRLGFVDAPEQALELAAYALIFMGTLVLGGIASFIMRRLLKAAMLTWVDRLAGGALGLLAAMLVAAMLVMPLVAYSSSGQEALRSSVLAPYVTVVADLANRWVPEELSRSYREQVESLRRYWRARLDDPTGTRV